LVGKVNGGTSLVSYIQKGFASFLNCEPAHCQHEPSILFALDSSQMKRNFRPKRLSFDFWTMMHWPIHPEVTWPQPGSREDSIEPSA
jgi:hypothetical protein